MRAARLPLRRRAIAPAGDAVSRHYLRFPVFDRPGVLARITGALGDSRVSIEQMVQQGGGEGRGAAVQVVLLTHAARAADVQTALDEIGKSDLLADKPRWLRVV
jgi:homoserine dehydrogenase